MEEKINKKRERSESDQSNESAQDNGKKKKLPKKSDFRMHAHCNPLADMTMP